MRRTVLALGAMLFGAMLGGCVEPGGGSVVTSSAPVEAPSVEAPAPEPPVAWADVPGVTGMPTGEVWAQWETLEVKGRAPKTGYARDQFGQRWKDIDRNGCDQRNDVLARDLTNVDAPQGCKVMRGVLLDPFTGLTIDFVRGQDTSSAVQIDHVVPLSDAWQKGAQAWDPETRERFANDPLNLLAVDGPQNAKKRDGDSATWQPPNTQFRCQYAATQVRVKYDYGLWVTPAEKDSLARELGRCGELIG